MQRPWTEEQLYRMVIESVQDYAIFMVDTEGLVATWSRGAEKVNGWAEEVVTGKHIGIFHTPEERAAGKAEMELEIARATGKFEEEGWRVRNDGRRYWAKVSLTAMHDEVGALCGFAAVLQDMTERKLAEEKLTRISHAVEGTSDAICMTDMSGRLIYHNPAFTRILGYTPSDLNEIGGARAICVDEEVAREVFETVGQGHSWHGEVELRSRDGSVIPFDLSADAITDELGQPVTLIGILTDVSEQKRVNQQLRQAQKMEAIGRLAGGIAHDFNNMLTAIGGYSELLLRKLKDGDPLRQSVQEIKKAADRSTALTRQLLAFSRKQMQQLRVFNINSVIGEMDNMLGRLIGEDVELALILDPALGQVRADPAQVDQVLMNLVVNARDAMPEGGRLMIETRNVRLDEYYAQQHVGSRPGSYVMLAVSDTGVGMDAETQARVFEPFFTTKEVGKGTGLGLSTVYGIVKQSQGYIAVYSEVGIGTTFKVYLPRVDEAAVVDEPEVTDEQLDGTETVLLVEDEELVRNLACEVLRMNGYAVIEATNGGEALLTCETVERQIDLLITDVVMPQMSGARLAERLRALRPELKVLFMSGYTEESIFHHGVRNKGAAFIEKPFSPDSFARKVREVLTK